jgi:hypothetical protein
MLLKYHNSRSSGAELIATWDSYALVPTASRPAALGQQIRILILIPGSLMAGTNLSVEQFGSASAAEAKKL